MQSTKPEMRLTDQEIVDQVFTEKDLRDDVWFTIARMARHQGQVNRVANGLTVGIERALLRASLGGNGLDVALNAIALGRILETEHAHA